MIRALGRDVSRLLTLSMFLLSPCPPQSANSIQGVSGELCTDGEIQAYGANASLVSEQDYKPLP